MQVQVTDIETQFAELGAAEQRVHVRAVAINQAAAVVDDPADFQDVGVEQAQGAGQGNHHPGKVVAGNLPERGQIGVAVSVGWDRNHVEAGHCRGGGISAVGAVRDAHLGSAGVAAGQVIRAHHEHAAQFAVGAGEARQAGGGHAGNLGEEVLQSVEQFQRSLGLLGRLLRMDPGESGQEGDLVVDLGVVLHRARPQRIEMGVDAEVQLAERGEILHHLGLGNLGQGQIVPQVGRIRAGARRGTSRPGVMTPTRPVTLRSISRLVVSRLPPLFNIVRSLLVFVDVPDAVGLSDGLWAGNGNCSELCGSHRQECLCYRDALRLCYRGCPSIVNTCVVRQRPCWPVVRTSVSSDDL